jgi:hypothetical protein
VVQASETLSQAEIMQSLKETPLYFFAHLNCVEFKSVNDPLEFHDLYRVYARALLAAARIISVWQKNKAKDNDPDAKRVKKRLWKVA